MSDKKMTGGCLCGDVSFETTGEPFAVNYCHCTDCRKHNGAPVVVLVGMTKGQVEWKGTERTIYESSEGAFRASCNKCGTPLTWEGDGGEELGYIFEMHVNTFANPETLVPTCHAFESERLSWFDVADDLPRYAGFAEDGDILHHGPKK